MPLRRLDDEQRKMLSGLMETDSKVAQIDKAIEDLSSKKRSLDERLARLARERAQLETDAENLVPKLRSLYPEALFPGDEGFPVRGGR